MVFAINSDESSARNFSAFQALAIELNGTASASSPSATSTSKSGASQIKFGFAALVLPLSFLLGLAL